jgi:hypothetical protein
MCNVKPVILATATNLPSGDQANDPGLAGL